MKKKRTFRFFDDELEESEGNNKLQQQKHDGEPEIKNLKEKSIYVNELDRSFQKQKKYIRKVCAKLVKHLGDVFNQNLCPILQLGYLLLHSFKISIKEKLQVLQLLYPFMSYHMESLFGEKPTGILLKSLENDTPSWDMRLMVLLMLQKFLLNIFDSPFYSYTFPGRFSQSANTVICENSFHSFVEYSYYHKPCKLVTFELAGEISSDYILNLFNVIFRFLVACSKLRISSINMLINDVVYALASPLLHLLNRFKLSSPSLSQEWGLFLKVYIGQQKKIFEELNRNVSGIQNISFSILSGSLPLNVNICTYITRHLIFSEGGKDWYSPTEIITQICEKKSDFIIKEVPVEDEYKEDYGIDENLNDDDFLGGKKMKHKRSDPGDLGSRIVKKGKYSIDVDFLLTQSKNHSLLFPYSLLRGFWLLGDCEATSTCANLILSSSIFHSIGNAIQKKASSVPSTIFEHLPCLYILSTPLNERGQCLKDGLYDYMPIFAKELSKSSIDLSLIPFRLFSFSSMIKFVCSELFRFRFIPFYLIADNDIEIMNRIEKLSLFLEEFSSLSPSVQTVSSDFKTPFSHKFYPLLVSLIILTPNLEDGLNKKFFRGNLKSNIQFSMSHSTTFFFVVVDYFISFILNSITVLNCQKIYNMSFVLFRNFVSTFSVSINALYENLQKQQSFPFSPWLTGSKSSTSVVASPPRNVPFSLSIATLFPFFPINLLLLQFEHQLHKSQNLCSKALHTFFFFFFLVDCYQCDPGFINHKDRVSSIVTSDEDDEIISFVSKSKKNTVVENATDISLFGVNDRLNHSCLAQVSSQLLLSLLRIMNGISISLFGEELDSHFGEFDGNEKPLSFDLELGYIIHLYSTIVSLQYLLGKKIIKELIINKFWKGEENSGLIFNDLDYSTAVFDFFVCVSKAISPSGIDSFSKNTKTFLESNASISYLLIKIAFALMKINGFAIQILLGSCCDVIQQNRYSSLQPTRVSAYLLSLVELIVQTISCIFIPLSEYYPSTAFIIHEMFQKAPYTFLKSSSNYAYDHIHKLVHPLINYFSSFCGKNTVVNSGSKISRAESSISSDFGSSLQFQDTFNFLNHELIMFLFACYDIATSIDPSALSPLSPPRSQPVKAVSVWELSQEQLNHYKLLIKQERSHEMSSITFYCPPHEYLLYIVSLLHHFWRMIPRLEKSCMSLLTQVFLFALVDDSSSRATQTLAFEGLGECVTYGYGLTSSLIQVNKALQPIYSNSTQLYNTVLKILVDSLGACYELFDPLKITQPESGKRIYGSFYVSDYSVLNALSRVVSEITDLPFIKDSFQKLSSHEKLTVFYNKISDSKQTSDSLNYHISDTVNPEVKNWTPEFSKGKHPIFPLPQDMSYSEWLSKFCYTLSLYCCDAVLSSPSLRSLFLACTSTTCTVICESLYSYLFVDALLNRRQLQSFIQKFSELFKSATRRVDFNVQSSQSSEVNNFFVFPSIPISSYRVILKCIDIIRQMDVGVMKRFKSKGFVASGGSTSSGSVPTLTFDSSGSDEILYARFYGNFEKNITEETDGYKRNNHFRMSLLEKSQFEYSDITQLSLYCGEYTLALIFLENWY
jgi:hypothetical protein